MKRGARVLLVDDDPDFLAMNRSVLEARGYRVTTLSSAQAALESARAEKPDLLVTDLMMSTLDAGFSLSRSFKDDPALASIPIIIVTAAASQRGFDFHPRSEGELALMHAEAFLEKPVAPAALLKKVEELLR